MLLIYTGMHILIKSLPLWIDLKFQVLFWFDFALRYLMFRNHLRHYNKIPLGKEDTQRVPFWKGDSGCKCRNWLGAGTS